MKKLKLMMLSLVLFAVVGAALAFKARFTGDYCVVQTIGSACPTTAICSLRSLASMPTSASGPRFCTVFYDGNNCNNGAGIPCRPTPPVALTVN